MRRSCIRIYMCVCECVCVSAVWGTKSYLKKKSFFFYFLFSKEEKKIKKEEERQLIYIYMFIWGSQQHRPKQWGPSAACKDWWMREETAIQKMMLNLHIQLHQYLPQSSQISQYSTVQSRRYHPSLFVRLLFWTFLLFIETFQDYLKFFNILRHMFRDFEFLILFNAREPFLKFLNYFAICLTFVLEILLLCDSSFSFR